MLQFFHADAKSRSWTQNGSLLWGACSVYFAGQSCCCLHLGKHQEWLSSGANDQNKINRWGGKDRTTDHPPENKKGVRNSTIKIIITNHSECERHCSNHIFQLLYKRSMCPGLSFYVYKEARSSSVSTSGRSFGVASSPDTSYPAIFSLPGGWCS